MTAERLARLERRIAATDVDLEKGRVAIGAGVAIAVGAAGPWALAGVILAAVLVDLADPARVAACITHQKAAADQQDVAGANARLVRFELQADRQAGVWMHSVYRRGDLTSEDVAQALDAAAVVGDDFQRNAAGEQRPPEEWTHGSSAQRQRWLTTGLEEGTPGPCDTFTT